MLCCRWIVTLCTRVRFFSTMSANVNYECLLLPIWEVTLTALVWLFTSVCKRMSLKWYLLRGWVITLCTLVWFFSTVSEQMGFEATSVAEHFVALYTFVHLSLVDNYWKIAWKAETTNTFPFHLWCNYTFMQIQVFTRVNCPNKDIRNQINSSWSFLNIIHIHIQKNDTPEMWRVALITSILTLTMFHRSSCKCGEWVRDGSRYQIRWIFGKVPNGLWPPPHFRKVTLQIF